MLFFSKELAVGFGDVEAEMSILALSPSIFFVCLMSAYRGYTQGHADMKLTSVSQIIEVFGKAVFGLLLAAFFLKYGLPAASAGAIAGVSSGSVLALVYSAIYVRRMKKDQKKLSASKDVPDSGSRVFKKLVAIAIPIAFGTSVLNFINLIDTRLIMSLLQSSAGYSYVEAKVLFGVFGKVQTLFNLPSSFIFPLAISLIPAISAYAAKRREREAAEAVRLSIKITTLLGLPAGVGLSVMAEPIMTVVYRGSAPEGAGLLMILGISSYFGCLVLITNAILQAYGRVRLPVFTVAAGGALKIAVDLTLVGNSEFGIYGAAIGTLACYALIAALNLIMLKRVQPQASDYVKLFAKPLICSALMGAAAYLSYPLFYSLAGSFLNGARVWTLSAAALTATIGISAIVYFAAISLTGALTHEELNLLPGGKKLAKILRIR
jgi:stage V sporulation protein B